MIEGISIREFARLDGCDDKVVRRKIKAGYLPVLEDGKLDPALVGTPWRARNVKEPVSADNTADSERVSARVRETADMVGAEETVEEAAERLVYEDGRVFATEAEAKRHKESFLALRQELEYDRETGLVVPVDEVVAAITAEYALVRNRLLNIASRVAPRAAVLKSADQVKALIDAEVSLVLEELRFDGNGRSSQDELRRSVRSRFSPVH